MSYGAAGTRKWYRQCEERCFGCLEFHWTTGQKNSRYSDLVGRCSSWKYTWQQSEVKKWSCEEKLPSREAGKGYTSKRLCEGDRAQEFRGNAQTELLLPETETLCTPPRRPQGRVPRSPAAPPDIGYRHSPKEEKLQEGPSSQKVRSILRANAPRRAEFPEVRSILRAVKRNGWQLVLAVPWVTRCEPRSFLCFIFAEKGFFPDCTEIQAFMWQSASR